MNKSLLIALFNALSFALPLAASAQPLELRPNLQALPAHDIAIEVDAVGRTMLRFGTMTWNSGDGAMELVAGETGQDRHGRNRQNVYQVVYLDDGSSYRRLAGTFVWHPSHNHFHVDDYAIYTLQPASAKGKSKLTSSKTSFCLMDTDQIDPTLSGAPLQPVYSGCNNVQQGISVGWADDYGAHLPGQEIDIGGLADGEYELSIDADPKGRLLETDDQDNSSCVLLRISASSLLVEVLNPLGCEQAASEDPTIVGIEPASANKGTTVPVIIQGSGFQPGLQVTLDNGSGPKPSVADVQVVDEATISATITVKNGGGSGDPIWDLHVGSAVLHEAFTVLP